MRDPRHIESRLALHRDLRMNSFHLHQPPSNCPEHPSNHPKCPIYCIAMVLHHGREIFYRQLFSEVSTDVNETDREMTRDGDILYKPICELREMSCSGRTILTEFKHVSVSVNEEASVWILYWETSVWAWQWRTRCPVISPPQTHTHNLALISLFLCGVYRYTHLSAPLR